MLVKFSLMKLLVFGQIFIMIWRLFSMKMNKSDRKKRGDELQEYLQFRRRGFQVKPKKGRGSYTRKTKHK